MQCKNAAECCIEYRNTARPRSSCSSRHSRMCQNVTAERRLGRLAVGPSNKKVARRTGCVVYSINAFVAAGFMQWHTVICIFRARRLPRNENNLEGTDAASGVEKDPNRCVHLHCRVSKVPADGPTARRRRRR